MNGGKKFSGSGSHNVAVTFIIYSFFRVLHIFHRVFHTVMLTPFSSKKYRILLLETRSVFLPFNTVRHQTPASTLHQQRRHSSRPD